MSTQLMPVYLNKAELLQWMQHPHNSELQLLLPEVTRLHGVPQPQEYHAEGDVFVHTRLALEALPDDADERVLWAVLLHDVGKADTTEFVEGRWRSRGHTELGAELAYAILTRSGREEIAGDVSWLVRHHHFALSWNVHEGMTLSKRQKRFCANPLFPLLCEVARVDAAASWGRSTKGQQLDIILACLKRVAPIQPRG
jgi:putative nucleotidyltransferase with HDIG domain